MRLFLTLVAVLAVFLGGLSQVVINEVAWGGTIASPYDEWIELYNPSDEPVDLTGWTLSWEGVTIPLGEESGATVVLKSRVIEPHGFFLLERGGDDTVVGREADLIYRGALPNSGAELRLVDPEGQVVDTANAGCPAGWWAGDRGISMERIAPDAPDGRFTWRNGVAGELLDAKGNPIMGSPGTANVCFLFSPRVELTLPEGPLSGVVTLTWQAADPDTPAEELTVMIAVSYDSGATLIPLAEELPATGTYDLDTGTEVFSAGVALLLVKAVDPEGHWGMAWQEVEIRK